MAEQHVAEEGTAVRRQDAPVLGVRQEPRLSQRVVVRPYPVEEVVVRPVDVELALEGARHGLVVELCPAIVDHVPIGGGQDRQEEEYRWFAGRRADGGRSEGQDSL